MTNDSASAVGLRRAAPRLSALIAIGIVIAIFSARPYAGGWNDGSRLAAVESLVDYHTWEISRSIFIAVPAQNSPYQFRNPRGSLDKMKIGDNWYSDKSPPVAIAMAGIYQILQWLTDLKAAEQPQTFCYLMALLTSGLAYVIAVLCVFSMAERLGLPEPQQWLVTASFALATVAPVYARSVNSHILILAAVSGICCLIVRPPAATKLRGHVLLLGLLAGVAYAIEQAAGPIVLMCTAALVIWRHRSIETLLLYAAGAAPPVLLYHALNFHFAGSFLPVDTHLQYFLWPGSPFDPHELTGQWIHNGVSDFISYAVLILFGSRGFFGHNLPGFLALAGIWCAWRLPGCRDLVLFAAAIFLGTWLLCAITSNNYSGVAVSIRWFVPLLAPIYLLICVILLSLPKLWKDLAVLTGVGLVLSTLLWQVGPWAIGSEKIFWQLQAFAGVLWLMLSVGERLGKEQPIAPL